jgi:DNA-directed RNA polymerase subunit RPC12/RpoP
MAKPSSLVVMRLIDMGVVHPEQINTYHCERCKQQVGIYPSGQKALRKYPTLEIVCIYCASGDRMADAEIEPASDWSEIQQEMRDSKAVSTDQ